MGIGTIIAVIGQLLLKKSATLSHENTFRFYFNKYVICGYALFLLSTLFSIYGFKTVPLSLGPAIEGFAQIVTAIFSVLFLKEKITSKKFLGILLIIVGLLLVCI